MDHIDHTLHRVHNELRRDLTGVVSVSHDHAGLYPPVNEGWGLSGVALLNEGATELSDLVVGIFRTVHGIRGLSGHVSFGRELLQK